MLLAVAVGVVLVGGGVTLALLRDISSQVHEEAVRDVIALVRPRILKMTSPQDLAQPMTGETYEALDRRVRDYLLSPDVVRLKLWNPERTVVYSTLPSQVGDSYPQNEHLLRALTGRQTWSVTREPESPQEGVLGELIEIYVPLVWEPSGRPAGVLEAYVAYEPYARLLASVRNAIFSALAVMLITLPVALYLIYQMGLASIRRQRDEVLRRQREIRALNQYLQRDIGHYVELRERILRLRDEVAQAAGAEGGEAPSARDAWLAMQIRELGEFATNLSGTEERKKPEKEE